MGKQLRIWPFVPLGSQLTSTSLLAEGVITMTTSKAVGETIGLYIEANGNIAIEGAQEAGQASAYGSKDYTIKSQVVVIRGDVKSLNCGESELTSLNLSQNTALTSLECSYNQLTSLDVSKNTALTKLDCCCNQLTSLNISKCARLEVLFCFSNCINGEAMTKLVNSLPNRKGESSGTLRVVSRSSKKSDKNRCSAADITTAKKKNWEVRQ